MHTQNFHTQLTFPYWVLFNYLSDVSTSTIMHKHCHIIDLQLGTDYNYGVFFSEICISRISDRMAFLILNQDFHFFGVKRN
jgi:hypothetical protein